MDRKTAIIAVLTVLLIFSTSTSYLAYQEQQHLIESQASIIEQLISASKTENANRTAQLPPYASVPEGANSAPRIVLTLLSLRYEAIPGWA